VAQYVLAEQRGEKAAQPTPTLESARKPGLSQVLAGVVGMPAEKLTTERRLDEIGLDPLRQLQLGRAVEDRLGKFLDDGKIGPDTTVGELESLLTSENTGGEHLYPLWPFSRRIRAVRSLLQWPIFTAINGINRPRIEGQEHVDHLRAPAIFVLKYVSLLDAPFALDALPERFRGRVGISTTWKNDRRRRWVAATVGLIFNSFRYSPNGSLHATLVHASGLLDHGWSVLFLVRDSDGAVERGIGLLATEFNVPVVPITLTGLERHIPLLRIPHRGSVTVTFGGRFHSGQSPPDARETPAQVPALKEVAP
jgi:long-chain acyl-CoA synthetase